MISESETSEFTSDSDSSDLDFLAEGQYYENSPDLIFSEAISQLESTRDLAESSVSKLSINVDDISQGDLEIVESICLSVCLFVSQSVS